MQCNVWQKRYFRIPTFFLSAREGGLGAAADSNLAKWKILIIFLSVIWEGTLFIKRSVECLMDCQI